MKPAQKPSKQSTSRSASKQSKDIMISIRVPSTLVKELKLLTEKNHYMDLSEHMRAIMREKSMQYVEPYRYELTKMREEMESKISANKAVDEKKKLVEELRSIIKELKE
jgi:Arc/MetJ-type ribon-helix-helix transcriptional regulator